MTKQTGYYFTVGITLLIAAFGFVVTAIFLNGWFVHSTHITAIFDNAYGATEGEFVTLSGVTIGKVNSVGLTPDNKARIELSIDRPNTVPVGSAFILKTALLQGQSTLTVIPSHNPALLQDGATVYGHGSDPLGGIMSGTGDLMATAKQALAATQPLLKELQKTTHDADQTLKMLSDPRRTRALDATLENVRLSSANLPILEAQAQRELAGISQQTSQLLNGLNASRSNADQVVGNANRLTKNLNESLVENRASLHALLHNAEDITDQVDAITEQLRTALTDKDLKANLTTTTQNLQSISAHLDATASDIQRLADDPRLNTDVRQTVSNLRASSESVKNLTSRFENIRLPGEKRKHIDTGTDETSAAPVTPTYFSSTSLLEPGLVFDTRYDTKVERFRFDGDYTLLIGKPGSFYRVGLQDATYGNLVNLEAGQGLFGNRFDYRYGLIDSKFGIGFDARTGPIDLRLDAYDPNHGTVNARAKFNLSDSAAVTAGIDSVGAGNRPSVGIQIRR